MGLILAIGHGTLSAILLILSGWLLLEVLAARPARGRWLDQDPGPIAVVIPAHNEGEDLAATIRDLKPQLRADDRLIVVADNCTDNTAAVALREGAKVLERQDTQRRGKGYALQHALDHLREDPPSTVIFTDADCFHSDGLIEGVAADAEARGMPVQALYLMKASGDASPARAVAAFAWLLINQVRMKGLWTLAKTTRLTGAGAAFPWAVAEELALGSGEIVEDLALTLSLAGRNRRVALNTEHVVSSSFPNDDEAAKVQRARWEHGSLRMSRTRIPSLLAQGLLKPWKAALALDVAIPPLSLLIGLLIVNAALGLIVLALGYSGSLVLALLAALAGGTAVLIAWVREGREALPPEKLAAVGTFILSKFGVYGKEARASTTEWTRTPRDGKKESRP